MAEKDRTGGEPERDAGRRLRIDRERAAEIVRAIKGGKDEPFGPLQLVRAVIRPVGRKAG